MSLTLADIKDRLAQQDEISLLEILNINSEELVERFEDKILDIADQLEEELE